MYILVYSDLAAKQLEKIDKALQKRIILAIERCRIRPHAHVKRLVGLPYFRLRVGDYRIVMDIKDNLLRIFVIKIDHRKRIYKK